MTEAEQRLQEAEQLLESAQRAVEIADDQFEADVEMRLAAAGLPTMP